jgi:hypothetical protein
VKGGRKLFTTASVHVSSRTVIRTV